MVDLFIVYIQFYCTLFAFKDLMLNYFIIKMISENYKTLVMKILGKLVTNLLLLY